MRELSVVVPTRDRIDILRETLSGAREAIREFDGEILVVNDGAESGVLTTLVDSMDGRLVQGTGKGAASARNLGARAGHGRVVLFLDDDIVTNEPAVNAALSTLALHPRACVAANWVYPPSLRRSAAATRFGRYLTRRGRTTLRGWFNDEAHWQEGCLFEVDSCAACHAAMTREVFNEWGGFDEGFTGLGGEDQDLSRYGSLGARGVRFFIDARVTVHHNEADKLSLEPVLRRYERTAENLPHAVARGLRAPTPAPPLHRRLGYRLAFQYRVALERALERLPDASRPWDGLHDKVSDLLIASSIWSGYSEGLRRLGRGSDHEEP